MYGEDIYGRKSFRYGQNEAPIYRDSVFSTNRAPDVHVPRWDNVVYQGDISSTYSTEPGDEFKFLPDDSIQIEQVQLTTFMWRDGDNGGILQHVYFD